MALNGKTNSEKIWNFFKATGMTDFGIAGLIGNLDAESGLESTNLENAYEKKLWHTDASYVAAVDNGLYQNFVNDCAGFGIAQWTWHTRKASLLSYARSKNRSIGDLEMQCEFLLSELRGGFSSVLNVLMNAKSVREASDAVLLRFECPADSSSAVQIKRANIGQRYYNMYSSENTDKKEVATMGYYKIKKGSKVKLSNNFYSNEFDCHGSGCCSETIINEQLVKYLQAIREHFNTSITITSGYRCSLHNSSVGGANRSRHTMGDAADIVVSGHTPAEVAKYAESIGIKGIGLYETSSDGFFVHIDTRDTKSFWYGQAQAYRSTFGGSTGASNSTSTASQPASSGIIMYGNSGAAVKELQEKLIKLGYSCGKYGADSSFGLGTLNAVKAFQKDAGFSAKEQDGIVGSQTMNAIDKKISELSRNTDGAKVYTVTASLLNVRSGAGLNNGIVATVRRGTVLTITEEKDDWGKMESGWVYLQYCQRKE